MTLAVVLSLVTGAVVVSEVAPALADAGALPTPVSSTALPTTQVDGVVWTQVVVGDTVYAGGQFTSAQPAGAAAGVGTVARQNLLAYDLTTGELIASFDPTLNGQVRGLASSPDGSRIYVVGDFTVVDGQTRDRVAAFDASTGALVAGFAPKVNASVFGVAATASTVYLGGAFTSVGTTARSRAAAVSASTGSLTAWAPQAASNTVRALAVSPDRSKVVLAGAFTSMNGDATTGRGLAAVDATTGSSLPWAASRLVYNHGPNSALFSLSSTSTTVYATGYVYGRQDEGNLEGTVAMSWSDGSVVWVEDCHGDTYSSVPFDGAVYTASHAHYCGNIGGFGESVPEAYHRALAFSQQATGTVAHNAVGPYYDFGGQPAPTLLDWGPDLKAGTYTGMFQAAWSVAAGGSYVVYGGEFTAVNGQRQTGLTRFLGVPNTDPGPAPVPPVTDPVPPVTPVASVPQRVARPDAVALGPSRVAVRWSAPRGASADEVTGYVIKAFRGSSVVKTVRAAVGTRLAVIAGLKRSTGYRIGVAAVNAVGVGAVSVLDGARTTAKGANVSATKHPSKVAKPRTESGRAQIKVRWRGASARGALAIDRYQIRVMKGGKVVRTVTVRASVRAKTITGLAGRTGYSISVRAGNWAGWGGWSTTTGRRTR